MFKHQSVITTFEANSREQSGRMVAAILAFTHEVKVTDVSGTENCFLVEADLNGLASDAEVSAIRSAA